MNNRSRLTAMYEGQVLSCMSQGRDYALENAEALADGAMNAIVRLRGAEAAAHFAFALCDRVAAGLREPTAAVLPKPDTVPAPDQKAAPAPVKPARRSVTGMMLQIIGAYAVVYQIIMWLAGR